MALVDANYKFIYVDVGAAGRAGDAGVFADSTLKQALTSNSLDLPSSSTISGISSKIEYHIVGDDAFPLTMRIMKPYPHRNLVKEKRIYNYRLSRACRVVENAFGILAHRWRVFLTKINLSPDKVTNVSFNCLLPAQFHGGEEQGWLCSGSRFGEQRPFCIKRIMEK